MRLSILLSDLQSNQLEVMLAPSRRALNEHDQIRVVVSRNPAWYRSMCSENISKRGTRRGKPDTAVRRQNILRVLTRLCAGLESRSKYALELVKVAGRIKL